MSRAAVQTAHLRRYNEQTRVYAVLLPSARPQRSTPAGLLARALPHSYIFPADNCEW